MSRRIKMMCLVLFLAGCGTNTPTDSQGASATTFVSDADDSSAHLASTAVVSPQEETNWQWVGDDTLGYIRIPQQWEEVTQGVSETGLQYAAPPREGATAMVTLETIWPTKEALRDTSQSQYQLVAKALASYWVEQTSEAAVTVKNTTVSGLPAQQLTVSLEAYQETLMIWVFQAPELQFVYYVAVEGDAPELAQTAQQIVRSWSLTESDE